MTTDKPTHYNDLSDEEREIVAYLLQKKDDRLAVSPEIPILENRERVRLSFAQQRMWFLNQLQPEIPAYNVSFALRLKGRLDSVVLELSLNEVVRRHHVLRTRFVKEDGKPLAVEASDWKVGLIIKDLSPLTPVQSITEAGRLAQEQALVPFDLSHGPLIRAMLIRLAGDDHILSVSLHHIVFDGWSIGILHRELSTFYKAFIADDTAPLPTLAIQYADFAEWQRQRLQGEALESQLAYWRRQLAGVTALQLPTDLPRPRQQRHRGATIPIRISRPLTEALKKLSRDQGATLFMTLLAAFMVLMARYSSQDDIVVGSPIANRTRTEIEGLIGFFVNTLALRADLKGDPSFLELVGRVQKVCLDAYDHQDLPFEKLVEELLPSRDLSRHPIFQVLFVLQNAPRTALELPGVATELFPLERTTVGFDIEAQFWEKDGTLQGMLIYDTDLFVADTISRLADNLVTLLHGAVADPDCPVSRLPVLSEPELRQIAKWNETTREVLPTPLHHLFEEHAGRNPDAGAIVSADQTLTYQELNERANQLAHKLLDHGVGTDTLVGIFLDRSVDLAVAVISVLKAGGAYVPFSLSYPRRRLAFMIEDANAPVILTKSHLTSQLPPHNAAILELDTDRASIDAARRKNPRISIDDDRLVYVLYTSGSTGRPKGVALGHQALLNYIVWQIEDSPLSGPIRTLQFSPLSFDASFTEMFMTWCSGGTLIMASERQRTDAGSLIDLIRDQRIERLILPFVALQYIAESQFRESKDLSSVSEILSTAEQLRVTPQIRKLATENPGIVLRNQYGPTETHVVTDLTLSPPAEKWQDLPSIGRPIANTQIHILDAFRQPVPIGVIGDLYIAGSSLARGYVNMPRETEERFVPNPFVDSPGARMYKTGDLARYRINGEIEFLGRSDYQVKIRGYRVELGEIESTLMDYPGVTGAVAITVESTNKDMWIATYVVTDQGGTPGSEELRSYLVARLPDYAIPVEINHLETLPLTPSGKIDRRALPAPLRTRPGTASYIGPRDHWEAALQRIWSEMLEVKQIGMKDDFFELGGHSLLGVRLVWQIEESLKVSLPLTALFRFSTIEGMAAEIRQSNMTNPESENVKLRLGLPSKEYKDILTVIAGCKIPAVRPGSLTLGLNMTGKKPPLFWCFNGPSKEPPRLAGQLGGDQPLYALYSGSGIEYRTPEMMKRIAHHYVEEMLEHHPDEPFRIGGNCGGAVVACEMAFQLQARGKTVERLCLLEYFEKRLFNYVQPLLLIYGKASDLKVQDSFGWPKTGWERPFRRRPVVEWTPGAHGEFFTRANIRVLGELVRRFLG